MRSRDPSPILIGVDAGGSGCRARVRGDPQTIRIDRPCNLLAGSAAREAILDTAVAAARGLSRLEQERAVLIVAAAGDTPSGRAIFHDVTHPFGGLLLMSDIHAAALGAFGGADCGLVVMGTGTAGCVLCDGQPTFLGGWGFAVDDVGSGADIGRLAVRAALRSLDGDVASGALTEAIADHIGADPAAMIDWARHARPADFAALAPMVFSAGERGDAVAETIMREALEALARLVRLVRSRGAERVAIAGSIAQRLATRPDAPPGLSQPLSDAIEGAFIAADRGLARAVDPSTSRWECQMARRGGSVLIGEQ